jgi:hypothetical protein
MSGKWIALATGAAAAAAAVGAYAIATLEEERNSELRAAMDIGSGAMKLVVAKVNKKTNKIIKVLGSEYIELLLAHDLKRSADNRLSEAILYQAIAVLRSLVGICDSHKVSRKKIYAVSTQVGPPVWKKTVTRVGLRVLC